MLWYSENTLQYFIHWQISSIIILFMKSIEERELLLIQEYEIRTDLTKFFESELSKETNGITLNYYTSL